MVGGGRNYRGLRPDDEAVAGTLPRGWLRRTIRSAQASAQPEAVPLKTVEAVLQLYRENYFDFNVRHFHEKLTEEHGLRIS